MSNTASFLGSLVLLGVFGCASAPPPDASKPDPAAEPAPPAPPPPEAAADPAPAPAAAAEPSPPPPPPPPPAEEKAATTSSAKAKAVTAGYTGPDACKLAVKGNSPVAQACRDGGAKAAKATMKDLVAKAKANGQKFRCDECHKDPQDITKLAADAPEKFKKLLAAAGK
jgi:hypothetical protein